jgi:hypothetical protein
MLKNYNLRNKNYKSLENSNSESKNQSSTAAMMSINKRIND